ncbi:MAG: hypothetical protein ACWGPS_09745 [Candidatus Promineifilaceae bacterium]
MHSRENVPSATWRWLGLSAVLILIVAVTMIGLISTGRFDPKPLGRLQQQMTFGVRDVAAGESILSWPLQLEDESSFTVRLTAALDEGETDMGYGLALGSEANYVTAAVSPTGYVTIQPDVGSGSQPTPSGSIPWQTWPHVRTGQQTNEIWANVVQGSLAEVRINRELLWQGNLPLDGHQVGLWAESFGGPAAVDFSSLEVFAPQP